MAQEVPSDCMIVLGRVQEPGLVGERFNLADCVPRLGSSSLLLSVARRVQFKAEGADQYKSHTRHSEAPFSGAFYRVVEHTILSWVDSDLCFL